MIEEHVETQLKKLLEKALDDAYIAGLEKGKITGRLAGIEEAAKVAENDINYYPELRARNIRALLEEK